MIKLWAINCGWLTAPVSFWVGRDDKEPLRAPVPAYLIEHPQGKVLFDTGMDMRFKAHVNQSPSSTQGFGVDLDESRQIDARLRSIGIDPAEIDFVALSHLHHDHCAALMLIPNATLLIQHTEYELAYSDSGPQYDKKYFDHGHPVKKLRGEFDVFGDGSLTLFPTPGHTLGHQSARIKLPKGDVILAADCCYLAEVLEHFNLSPGSCDRELHLHSLKYLKSQQDKGCRILFGHEPKQIQLTQEFPVLIE